jgi:hypothetical protein
MTSSFLFSFSPHMGFLSRLYHENRTALALFAGCHLALAGHFCQVLMKFFTQFDGAPESAHHMMRYHPVPVNLQNSAE